MPLCSYTIANADDFVKIYININLTGGYVRDIITVFVFHEQYECTRNLDIKTMMLCIYALHSAFANFLSQVFSYTDLTAL